MSDSLQAVNAQGCTLSNIFYSAMGAGTGAGHQAEMRFGYNEKASQCLLGERIAEEVEERCLSVFLASVFVVCNKCCMLTCQCLPVFLKDTLKTRVYLVRASLV